jgi:STE24 endopeptidase
LLDQFEKDLPVHAPPTRGQFVRSQVRLQLLFILLPIVMIMALRDAILIAAALLKFNIGRPADFENWVLLPAGALVYLFAPSILRRVLRTRPLDDSPLRRRLESICQRMGLKYREILLWQTDFAMGNAAVMGLFPRVRYILLSDLLVESMTDEQIEAVFAHELGHVVHRHMAWYVAFFGMIVLAAIGVEFYVQQALAHFNVARWVNAAVLQMGLSLLGMMTSIVLIFGYLSRRFERQADVFAARMMQSDWTVESGTPTHVGERGAGVFAGALRRVAAINNIPEERRSWCHGSIAKRARYLLQMSADPALTHQFDKLMSRLYLTLVTALFASAAIAWHVQGNVARASDETRSSKAESSKL